MPASERLVSGAAKSAPKASVDDWSLAQFLLAAVRIERERLRSRGSWKLAGRGRNLSCEPPFLFEPIWRRQCLLVWRASIPSPPIMSHCPLANPERVPPPFIVTVANRYISFDVIFLRTFASGSKALSARPARPPEILPGTPIRIALRIQGLRTRVFRGIELEHHPLRVRNARI